ncbi:autotransporter outer membrane beta-barrel domain-containing protein [Acidisoma silvae]|uniref:Autotransporter outer membrane beta-barrel domain-containing protein n=1 Tax=Acidisoma silvae TaxID=2802396 RepID=A0A964DYR9_9PROT|nr:autotransporter outer membrane beta-barrel domain-containing protein [Acidisoma silvae]MCB8875685.1 autotransporter outer membrane beta-barrel domain-containing protein [Acidisoma silvae]
MMGRDRRVLLQSLRAFTCLVPVFAIGVPASAAMAQVLSESNKGANGTGSFPGSPGASITKSYDKTTLVARNFNAAVSLSSTGGTGSSSGTRGGNGGAVTLTLSGNAGGTRLGNDTAIAALVSVLSLGGAGGTNSTAAGAGGAGGTVTVTVTGTATTVSNYYAALWARSVGGAAGTGGTSVPAASPGGNGGAVTVTIGPTGVISTSGSNAIGVYAQSVGGAGVARDASFASADVSQGGNGGAVTFTNNGTITTTGASSSAVYLASVGGNGGVQAVSSGAQTGGKGGNGGTVVAYQNGTIRTTGNYSFGIVAQSAGGNGGKGAGSLFGIGGDGGEAGSGGSVTVTNTGSITTSGTGSAGIVADSTGGGTLYSSFQTAAPGSATAAGGGGAGGSTLFGAFPGKGGQGADGGTVAVYNSGSIATAGTNAYGILAQSVGGVGGAGGGATSLGLFFSSASAANGGGGGNGGSVTVLPYAGWTLPDTLSNVTLTNEPTITTTGASATGIFAQSVGGGGGTGGAAWSLSAGALFDASVSIGGKGGQGGTGGEVDVGNLATISTSGNYANGILAQSVGGGGGNGGSATATAVSVGAELPTIGITVAVGGSGGLGGNGGDVTVANLGAISTSGQQAAAIFAQSIGGGGGNGGATAASTQLVGLDGAFGVSTAVGGSGGSGGVSGNVSVVNEGQLLTTGAFSNGITAQSVGGGGGDGGVATAKTGTGFGISTDLANALWGSNAGTVLLDTYTSSLTSSLDSGLTVALNFAVGGSGGDGGSGGAVTVTNSGTIQTTSLNSTGIFAQSIGGGGGTAEGVGSTGSASKASSDVSLDLNVTVGGSGGLGGNGGTVTVENAASGVIDTAENGSSGIVAQSIGGGGGSAGSQGVTSTASSTVAVKFKTDSATITKAGVKYTKLINYTKSGYKVVTKALAAKGVEGIDYVLSKAVTLVGGTKGSYLADYNKWIKSLNDASEATRSGLSSALVDKVSAAGVTIPVDVGLNVGVGGTGGSGGNGGNVTVANDGSILVYGDQSDGILAQSIGGGGGVGGNGALNQGNAINVGLSVGGTGGSGGVGGDVAVTNAGDITTLGSLSQGILAQSVGGGGGIGGASSGSAKGLSLSKALQVGGSGGSSQNAGTVSAINSGVIETLGDQSQAIMAQSIGGGGGVSLLEGTPDVSDDTAGQSGTAQSTTEISLTPSLAFADVIGGSGGGGGSGSTVSIENDGLIVTAGAASFGILAQSIGGGGGAALNSNLASLTSMVAKLGATGASGNGGVVTVNLSGASDLLTLGDGSIGVVAQSVGGGGGYGGTASWLTSTVSSTAASGNGSAIAVAVGADADILTMGAQADGLYLQSLGGGGGLVTNAIGPVVVAENSSASRTGTGGTGGAITVDGRGSIVTLGDDASAIIAQSGMQKADGSLDPSKAGGNITINWDGTLVGGDGTGVGVLIDGGATNTLTIGADGDLSALSGNAVQASFGNDTVNDAGTITGSIDLDGGKAGESNAVNILTGGVLNAGDVLDVGAAGLVTNRGRLNIAQSDVIGTTNVTGNFVNSGGTIGADVDYDTLQSDLLNVSGAAQLNSGQIAVNLIDLPSAFNPADMPAVSVVTAQSLSVNSAFMASPTVALTYGLVNTGSNAEGVKITQANFMPQSVSSLPDVTDNMKSVAQALQGAWDAGNLDDYSQVFTYLGNITDPETYAHTLSMSDDEQAAVPAMAMLFSALQFQKTLHSCPVFVEDTTLLNEQDCVYLRNIASASTMAGNAGGSGYHGSSYAVELGGEKQFAPGWFIGGAIAPGQSWSADSADNSEASSNTLDVGIVVKHFVTSRLLLAGSLSYGNQSTTLSRTETGTEDGTLTTQAQQELNRGTGRLRAEYDIPFKDWYIRPMMDVDLTYTHMTPFTESGGSFLDVSYKATDKVVPDLSPTFEIGKRLDYKNLVARLYADIGMTWFIDPTWQQEGSFVGLPDASFSTYAFTPALVGNFAVGAQLVAWHNLSLEAEYDGTYSPAYVNNMGTIRADWRF